MRVEVFSPTAVRLWRGWLWWKRYREAIFTDVYKTEPKYPEWRWMDTDKTVDIDTRILIERAVYDWHWKQPAPLPNAIVVKKKVGF